MTAELFTDSVKQTEHNTSAALIIDAFRDDFADRTTLAPIEMEFPYMKLRDKDSIYLLEAADNLAGTFKWRGALVGAVALQGVGHERLVVPSAGNHARGAVLAAKVLGMAVDVVVPRSAPPAKREGLRELWHDGRNKVHVYGETFDASLAHAYGLARERGGALLHPYDDEFVIEGQGTIIDDLLREKPEVTHVVLPVGGGGLLAGVANRLTELGRDDVRVTAVEAPGSNSLSKSLQRRRLVEAESPNQRFGGSAVRYIGARGLESALRYPNLEVVSADEGDIIYVTETYMQSRDDLLRKSIPAYEPTSLVAVAGLYKATRTAGDVTVALGTGHNAPVV